MKENYTQRKLNTASALLNVFENCIQPPHQHTAAII